MARLPNLTHFARADHVTISKMRHRTEQQLTQLIQRVEADIDPHNTGKSPQDRPILTRLTRWEGCPIGILDASLGIQIDAVLFGVGGSRQDHIGDDAPLCIAMMPLIDQ